MPPEPVDLVPLLAASKVTVVAGKGGVGKTTVTALLARAAALAGQRVLAIELDGKPVLAALLAAVDQAVGGGAAVPVLALSPAFALEEYLRDHGFGRFARRLSASGVIDVVSTAAPGIDDLVVLGKIKQLERGSEWDVILVDGPAAGHAVTMLTAAAGLQDAVSSGPVRVQADDVLELLTDPARCQVALVTLAETTPVNETVATAFAIEDRVGVRLAPVFVNGVDPEVVDDLAAGTSGGDRLRQLDAFVAGLGVDDDTKAALTGAARFCAERRSAQRAAIGVLAGALPLGQLHVPTVSGQLDPASLVWLAAAVRRPADVRAAAAASGR